MAPKKKVNPRGKVFSFWADKETAELIARAAGPEKGAVSGFLLQAVRSTALSETLRANVSDRLWTEA